ncbi:hypothetical protein ADIS_1685 [Lunatimonas lonarensis]|uniref:Uncharacterized protein n=1 Tax=Lunatimonas lonarensis TaxID=1232681 RepID=R7ZUC8_9BACT|nr:hypothetical protein ADIS_1685 [Lunatimonas lonarensis]
MKFFLKVFLCQPRVWDNIRECMFLYFRLSAIFRIPNKNIVRDSDVTFLRVYGNYHEIPDYFLLYLFG